MLFHAVLFNFKTDVSKEKREEILGLARTMLPPIPGVMNLLAGANIKENSEYEYIICMYFDSIETLETYRAHPEHERFRDVEFFPYVAEKQSIDFED